MGFQSALTGTINTILGSVAVQQLKRNTSEEAYKMASEALNEAGAKYDPKSDAYRQQFPYEDYIMNLRSTQGRQSIAKEEIPPDDPRHGKERGAYSWVGEITKEWADEQTIEGIQRVMATSRQQMAQMLKISPKRAEQLGYPTEVKHGK